MEAGVIDAWPLNVQQDEEKSVTSIKSLFRLNEAKDCITCLLKAIDTYFRAQISLLRAYPPLSPRSRQILEGARFRTTKRSLRSLNCGLSLKFCITLSDLDHTNRKIQKIMVSN